MFSHIKDSQKANNPTVTPPSAIDCSIKTACCRLLRLRRPLRGCDGCARGTNLSIDYSVICLPPLSSLPRAIPACPLLGARAESELAADDKKRQLGDILTDDFQSRRRNRLRAGDSTTPASESTATSTPAHQFVPGGWPCT